LAERCIETRAGDNRKPELFAQILVEEGILNPESLRRLVDRQQALPPEERRVIGRLAVDEGYLDESTFLALLDRCCHRLYLGELLVLRNLLTLHQLEQAMQEQTHTGELLGEVLTRAGYLTASALAGALAEQSGTVYIPIASIPPDPELARWVNRTFATVNGVVPITRKARNLVVAVWQPRALVIAADLEQATGLNVQILLTTKAEVEARIQALYAA